ncbi:MAG TPA: 3-methyl-2-oxobutanoate hydroxymethyltransferase, partial [Holophaga sp.]|nr:3-methyl-2-oxobutanoate hydroxymethyltransferase [Holophaga sp.]
LEGVPADLAARITQELTVPTIGIGAGPDCSGQVLVFHDILGLIPGPAPKFVRSYLDGFNLMKDAIATWAGDVQEGAFPGPAESYMLPDAARAILGQWRSSSRSAIQGGENQAS